MTTPRSVSAVAFLSLLLSAACTIGPGVGGFRPAQGPEGVSARLTLTSEAGELAGEVLAVEESALLIYVHREGSGREERLDRYLARVPFGAVRRADFQQVGKGNDVLRDPEFLGRLRLVSRYPQGVSEELLARIEQAYGEVRMVEP